MTWVLTWHYHYKAVLNVCDEVVVSGKVSAVKEENGKREAAEVDPPAETCWQRTRKIIERWEVTFGMSLRIISQYNIETWLFETNLKVGSIAMSPT